MPKSTCGSCHETFSTTGNFDRHRITIDRTRYTRRCLTREEMQAKGLILNGKGIWAFGLDGSEYWRKGEEEQKDTLSA